MAGYFGKSNLTTNVDGFKNSNVYVDEEAAKDRGPLIQIEFDENGEIKTMKGPGVEYDRNQETTEE
jgi:hypothetical protein